ncbi:hypothetical protein [Sphingorhabdus sp.]|jgi:hypothetical protein|uniref:hypothetical protein n=1 Tax=Sphingorhabdus sp. TaxID=1902408 RepID=UPI0037C7EBDB
MTAALKDVLVRVLLVIGLALVWYGVASANGFVFQKLALSPNAHLIFLPAALRIIYPLVFRAAGVLAIIMASYFVVQDRVNDGIIDIISLAVMSGLAPLAGIGVFKRLFTVKPDLADLKAVHFVALGALCAASNALLLNAYFILSGHPLQPLDLLITIFIGDVMGTLIVMLIVSFVLTFFISRRRV